MRIKLWMLAAILTIYGTMMMGLTSCSSNQIDNPAGSIDQASALAKALVGEWILEMQVDDIELDNQEIEIDSSDNGYTVAFLYHFNEDGTCWKEINVMGDGQLTYQPASRYDLPLCNYSVDANGHVSIEYEDSEEGDELLFDGTRLTNEFDGIRFYFERATDEQTYLYMLSSDEWHGGEGSEWATKDIDPDVANVKYTVIKDTIVSLAGFVENVAINQFREPIWDDVIAQYNHKSRSKTRSLYIPPTAYRCVSYIYESVDEQGEPVTLSGLVQWGVFKLGSIVIEISPNYMVLSPHFTISDDYEAPSNLGAVESMVLSGDRLLILPDYIGFGATKDRPQPYVVHSACAQNSIDAMLAGYKVYKDLSKVRIEDDWKLYVAGLSQGGGNALAIHKWLDTHADMATRWRFDASYCCAGPYNPLLTFKEYFKNNYITYPVVLPVTMKAMMAAYPDVLGKWMEEDFYSESYLTHKAEMDVMVESKEYGSSAINKKFFEWYANPEMKEKIGEDCILLTDILSPALMDETSEIRQALDQCLALNDLTTGWTPTHPIHLFHGRKDNVVPYANAQAVKDAFGDKVTLIDASSGKDGHLGACGEWMSFWFLHTWWQKL